MRTQRTNTDYRRIGYFAMKRARKAQLAAVRHLVTANGEPDPTPEIMIAERCGERRRRWENIVRRCEQIVGPLKTTTDCTAVERPTMEVAR